MANEIFCEKCGRTKNEKEFYGSHNLEKYPNGKVTPCKQCITMHVDNWNPETYLWILQECDVPYIQEEWSKLLETYAKDPSKVSGMTIIGRYLSKMQLRQFKDYRWSDTEFLQQVANNKIEQAMKRQGYGAAEIAQQISRTNIEIPENGFTPPPIPITNPAAPSVSNYFDEINGMSSAEDDLVGDLSDEDKTYLRLKWGKSYKPEEWVRLEQLYTEMMNSYDIQSAGHEDVLKLVCKTSLKANQLLDIGDVDGAQKMVKMYDSLMKSGKFTAAQNKIDGGNFVDSFSEFAELCEKEGFIPRFYSERPNDKVDETLLDINNYTKDLITNEMNLGNLIENAVRQMTIEEAKEEDEDTEDELTYENIEELKDEDFNDFNDFIDSQTEEDFENGLTGFTRSV